MTTANTPLRTLTTGTALQTPGFALMVGALVICVCLLSVFGHLVQKQVERGAGLREIQRAGLYTDRGGNVLRTKRAQSAESVQLIAGASPR